MRRLVASAIFALALACYSQQPPTLQYAEPTTIPADRVDESYTIYSQLLVSGPIEWRDAKRKQWLIEEQTSATPLNTVCHPYGPGQGMDPHRAVTAPEDRKSEWLELLADFDTHCHDVFLLQGDKFRTDLPIHLLNAAQKKEFEFRAASSRNRDEMMSEEFKDAAGLHRFSAVFFNQHHTLALVEQGIWCAGLCGNWRWVVLEKKEGRWIMLPWVRMGMIS